ncbi:MAG: dihydroorotate dehydrogenase electron transfer subunit [Phocaeicola sp.]|nr:dihydroorotate dehydrogenase electron transfer subunit [Phocaeicola sp.]MDD7448660.1 dihydroorotate dehydrogenase electron transfer subunit [Prevotellaceae bacterium]MDY5938163.1 dihydroorotate dehydrogenase electron transfer subunit [Phocaeicola sp.]
MKKYILDLRITENIWLNKTNVLIKATHSSPLPEILPGQFAELRVDGTPHTFLRRPISINFVDRTRNEIWFLIQTVGNGTQQLATLKKGDLLNVVFPLGNTFTLPREKESQILLVGGGVGIAPMLYWGDELKKKGFTPVFLLGGRSAENILELEDFRRLGEVHITTEDGSMGEQGYVTQHSILQTTIFTHIYTCGPKAMMQAVARYAQEKGTMCEVSLENTMACGIGACLCCVEKTKKGNTCVCTEGPIFNINELIWQI